MPNYLDHSAPVTGERVRKRAQLLCSSAQRIVDPASHPDKRDNSLAGLQHFAGEPQFATFMSALIMTIHPRLLDHPSQQLLGALATAHEVISIRYRLALTGEQDSASQPELMARYAELTSPESLLAVLTAILATPMADS